jgi:hypothetical protein
MVAIFPASTKAGGGVLGLPDVVKVPAPPAPPIPTPFPNSAQLNQATDTSKKVLIVGKEACTKKSQVPRSMGDEAGTLGGLVSNVNMDKVTYKKGTSKVKIEGAEVVHLTSMTAHNGSNANMPAGAQIAPSQAKVIIAP